MKKISVIILALAALFSASCTKSSVSYSDDLKSEKKLIDEYVKRNHINIIHEEPPYDQWGENDYLELKEYCYFHLSLMGDTATDSIKSKDYVNMRYRKYTLNPNADTLSYWNTNEMAYPVEFQYNVSSSNACTAWHYALPYLRYTGAEGKLICPSKLGFDADNKTVTPYGYDLHVQIARFK